MNDYQKMIAISRYSRWLDDKQRRETWEEVVARYFDFIEDHCKKNLNYELKERRELEEAVVNLRVLPSMRALWTAGPALERDNLSSFNCFYIAIDSPRAFDEILYASLQGVGCGFSVEEKFISKLPVVNEHFEFSNTTLVVNDDKAGWAKALRELISLLYVGQIPKWDLSKLRPAGARCVVSGGRASGPDPLDRLFRFVVATFKNAAGRRLTSLECHDMVCKISEAVVAGANRKGALISLSGVADDLLRDAKSGSWWVEHPERSLSNNSAVYESKPGLVQFMNEWKSLYKSKSGERGIFNREAGVKQMLKYGKRKADPSVGLNPCGEVLLRGSGGLCNLSNTIVRPEDTLESFLKKLEYAAILGTIQSSLTKFKYLRKIWSQNAEEERLLGVGLNGVYDNISLFTPENLCTMREKVVEVNADWAARLGINPSVATTVVKPDGNSSALCNTASGMHPRYAEYFIRTVRADTKDPITQLLIDQGVPWEVDIMKPETSVVFSFPQKSPEGAILRGDVSAIEHLNLWKSIRENYTEHNPSVTVSVRESEWLDVQAWVYKNFDTVCGVSFLPYSDDDHTYKQAPFQECSKEEYNEWINKMPKKIDWDKLSEYEKEDSTEGAQTLACTGGYCEMVSIGG